MELAALGNAVQHRVGALWPFQVARKRCPVQAGQVLAFQKSHEVGCRVGEGVFDYFHESLLPTVVVHWIPG